MPIEIQEAGAVCSDCGEKIQGDVTVSVWDFGHVTPLGIASGRLTRACAVHP